MKLRTIAFTAALAALPCSAQAALIDFGNLDTSGPFGGNGAAFSTYSEDGFTVSATAPGQYVQATQGSNITPSTLPALLTGSFNGTQNAGLAITNGDTFTFAGLDFFSTPSSVSSFSIAGYLGGSLLFSTASSSLATGATTYTSGNGGLLDRLVISTNSDGQLYVDNINVTRSVASAVPEPATWAMMIVGFGMAGAALRRRKRPAVAFA